MKQRAFPWMQSMGSPKDAPMRMIAKIRQESHAVVLAMKVRGGGYTDSWFAEHLTCSRSYFCEIKRGAKDVPDWFIEPFCALTGSNILRQYLKLQKALRAADMRPSLDDELTALAEEMRRAA